VVYSLVRQENLAAACHATGLCIYRRVFIVPVVLSPSGVSPSPSSISSPYNMRATVPALDVAQHSRTGCKPDTLNKLTVVPS
jgi:hypothetical protein